MGWNPLHVLYVLLRPCPLLHCGEWGGHAGLSRRFVHDLVPEARRSGGVEHERKPDRQPRGLDPRMARSMDVDSAATSRHASKEAFHPVAKAADRVCRRPPLKERSVDGVLAECSVWSAECGAAYAPIAIEGGGTEMGQTSDSPLS